MAILPPASALSQLEPRPGGQWAITGQSEDGFSLSYTMDEGVEAVAYTAHQCTTEEEVQAHCGLHVYEFTETPPIDSVQNAVQNPAVSHNTNNPPLHLVLRPRTQIEELEAHLGQTSGVPNLNQVSFNIQDTQAPIVPQLGSFNVQGTQTPIVSQVVGTTPGTLQFGGASAVPENQVYQETQTPSIRTGQQGLPVNLTSEAIDWSFGSQFLPANHGNITLPMHNTMMGASGGSLPDNHMFPSATWQENWTPLNELAGHGAGLDWETMFSNS